MPSLDSSPGLGAATDLPPWVSGNVRDFAAGFDFPLDEFQLRACQAVENADGVLVAAPTGSGKTVVGEYAVHAGLRTGRKAFYTTPIKALSNQKYADLVRRHGAENVGLLTGDSSVNGEAPVVVMTTEVLRNMMYAGSRTLRGLGYVVMDEVHYLADRFRGAVWEEVIIHLPQDVQVVSLSATVSNAEEFGAWLGAVRGTTEVIVEEHRPVPLWQHMMVGQDLYDLFVDDGRAQQDGQQARINPELLAGIERLDRRWTRADAGGPRGRRGKSGRPAPAPAATRGGRPGGGATRTEVIRRLDRDGLLPAITFIFSRAGCESAVGALLASGVRLIPDHESRRIRTLVETRVGAMAEQDLGVLGYWDFVEGLSRGFGAHHAGMLPTFREIVEELFTAGAIRAVFATETLALGINMPARTVVLERLVKFNGETHADITPAEYTQLTGRAGRRGIDIEGHAVVLAGRNTEPNVVAGLASTRTFPLRSSFRPTYNMAVNLVAQFGRARAREILATSFAQFQADRAVVGMANTVRRNENALLGYAESMSCERGDFTQYAALRNQVRDLEKGQARSRSASRRVETELSLERLVVGDVVLIPRGRRAGLAVVVPGRHGGPLPTVLTADAQSRTLMPTDVHEPLEPVARVPIPTAFSIRNVKSRRDLAATVRAKVPHPPPRPETPTTAGQADERITALRRQLRAHPCHACPDRETHARWAERWWRLTRETDQVKARIESRTGTVARAFERICVLLGELGYLSADGESVTAQGEVLRRIYSEKDLLVAESLRSGAWGGLDAADLAAVVSMLVYEPRRDGDQLSATMPSAAVDRAYDTMLRVWSRIEDRERAETLLPMGAPDAGMAAMMRRWSGGQPLELVLRDANMAAGDFVRKTKQVIDLLGQIRDASTDAAVSAAAGRASTLILRGVVAADRLD